MTNKHKEQVKLLKDRNTKGTECNIKVRSDAKIRGRRVTIWNKEDTKQQRESRKSIEKRKKANKSKRGVHIEPFQTYLLIKEKSGILDSLSEDVEIYLQRVRRDHENTLFTMTKYT